MSENNNSDPDFVVDDMDLSDPEIKGWDGVAGPSLPAGDYEVEIVGAAIEATTKGGRQLVLDLRVANEGEYFDATCKHWVTFPHSSHKDGGKGALKRVVHVVRDTLDVPLLPGGGFEGSALIGRRMIINVALETTTTYDAASNQDITKVRMRISNERPVAGAAPSAQPATAVPSNARPATNRRPAAAQPAGRRPA